jgi:hypothetical protein
MFLKIYHSLIYQKLPYKMILTLWNSRKYYDAFLSKYLFYPLLASKISFMGKDYEVFNSGKNCMTTPHNLLRYSKNSQNIHTTSSCYVCSKSSGGNFLLTLLIIFKDSKTLIPYIPCHACFEYFKWKSKSSCRASQNTLILLDDHLSHLISFAILAISLPCHLLIL